VVQYTLPVDVNAPGIIATTRPVGSVNSKNGAVVELLRPGQSVTPKQVEEFVARVEKAPFKEIATVLIADTQVSPCPVCRGEGSRLDVLDRVGMCYACGKVNIEQLFDAVFLPVAGKPVTHDGRADQMQGNKKSSRKTRSDAKRCPK
jgi:hypothetical protein